MSQKFETEDLSDKIPPQSLNNENTSTTEGVVFSEKKRAILENRGGIIMKFIVKSGLAKNEKTATTLLSLIVIICLFFTIYVWFSSQTQADPVNVTRGAR